MTGDPLETVVLNTVIVTRMPVVPTTMVLVRTGHVRQDGQHIHAAKVLASFALLVVTILLCCQKPST